MGANLNFTLSFINHTACIRPPALRRPLSLSLCGHLLEEFGTRSSRSIARYNFPLSFSRVNLAPSPEASEGQSFVFEVA